MDLSVWRKALVVSSHAGSLILYTNITFTTYFDTYLRTRLLCGTVLLVADLAFAIVLWSVTLSTVSSTSWSAALICCLMLCLCCRVKRVAAGILSLVLPRPSIKWVDMYFSSGIYLNIYTQQNRGKFSLQKTRVCISWTWVYYIILTITKRKKRTNILNQAQHAYANN